MSTVTDAYRSTPRTIQRYVERCLYAGKVPYIKSSPGLGKSAIVRAVAKKLNLFLIDHRLSTSPPEDLSGLPRFDADGNAVFAPFKDLFPVEGMQIPDGYDGWLVFLDELPSAKRETLAGVYKLILDRMVGQRNLHQCVHIVCAGNLITDRAIVNPLGTALDSRLVHLPMKESYEEWLLDVAIPEKYDHRLVSFISQYPSKLMEFDPSSQNPTFTCPRTLEFLNDLVIDQEIVDEDAALYAGTITASTAIEFMQYCKVFKNLTKFEDIIKDPLNAPIPYDNSTSWATISIMMERITDKNFGNLSAYADRFPLQFRVLFYRFANIRNPEIRYTNEFIHAVSQIGQYLNG